MVCDTTGVDVNSLVLQTSPVERLETKLINSYVAALFLDTCITSILILEYMCNLYKWAIFSAPLLFQPFTYHYLYILLANNVIGIHHASACVS